MNFELFFEVKLNFKEASEELGRGGRLHRHAAFVVVWWGWNCVTCRGERGRSEICGRLLLLQLLWIDWVRIMAGAVGRNKWGATVFLLEHLDSLFLELLLDWLHVSFQCRGWRLCRIIWEEDNALIGRINRIFSFFTRAKSTQILWGCRCGLLACDGWCRLSLCAFHHWLCHLGRLEELCSRRCLLRLLGEDGGSLLAHYQIFLPCQ